MSNEQGNNVGEYLTPEQAAERLGVCRKTIYNSIKSNRLVFKKLGRHYRMKKEWVDALLSDGPVVAGCGA